MKNVRGCRLGDNILSPSTLYMFGVILQVVSSITTTTKRKSVKLPNCLIYFYIVKNYVGYNNTKFLPSYRVNIQNYQPKWSCFSEGKDGGKATP